MHWDGADAGWGFGGAVEAFAEPPEGGVDVCHCVGVLIDKRVIEVEGEKKEMCWLGGGLGT